MMDLFKCKKCEAEKSSEEYPVNIKMLRGFDSWCRDCHTKKGKESYHKDVIKSRKNTNKRRRDRIDWLQSFKNKPCIDCGKLYESHCMDFDHLRDKTKGVTRMLLENASEKRILEEIEKCDLVCVLCHNVRTQKRLDEKYPVKKYSKYTVRNIEIINKAKNMPCNLCGIVYPSYNMQLDHIDPNIKYKDISQLKNFKVDTLIKELEKCQVFCALCHRRKSIFEQRAKKYPANRIKSPKIKLFSDLKSRTKECGKCNKTISFDLFVVSRKSKDGCHNWCKECFNGYKREKRKTT